MPLNDTGMRSTMWHRTLLFGLLLVAGCIAVATAAPALPCEYYGEISIGGSPAPVGTSITATIGGAERGRLVTSAEGTYGGLGTFDTRLLVQAAEGDDTSTVTFFVNGIALPEAAEYAPGAIVRVDLALPGAAPEADTTIPTTVPTTIPTTAPVSDSGGSSSSSSAGSTTPTTAPVPSQSTSPAPSATLSGAGTPDRTSAPVTGQTPVTLPRFDTAAPTPEATTQQAPLQYAPFAALAVMLVMAKRR